MITSELNGASSQTVIHPTKNKGIDMRTMRAEKFSVVWWLRSKLSLAALAGKRKNVQTRNVFIQPISINDNWVSAYTTLG